MFSAEIRPHKRKKKIMGQKKKKEKLKIIVDRQEKETEEGMKYLKKEIKNITSVSILWKQGLPIARAMDGVP